MSSKKSEQTLKLEPVSSRQLAMLLLMLHGSAMLVVLNLALPAWALATLALFLVANLWLTFSNHILGRTPNAVLQLVWEDGGDWQLMSRDGDLQQAELLPRSFVNPMMIVLNFRLLKGGRRSVVLMPDALRANTWHQLLLRLKLEVSR